MAQTLREVGVKEVAVGDLGAALRAEQIEELARRGAGASRGALHHLVVAGRHLGPAREMIEPTVSHATRAPTSVTVDLDDAVANQATVSSKGGVWPAS